MMDTGIDNYREAIASKREQLLREREETLGRSSPSPSKLRTACSESSAVRLSLAEVEL